MFINFLPVNLWRQERSMSDGLTWLHNSKSVFEISTQGQTQPELWWQMNRHYGNSTLLPKHVDNAGILLLDDT
ncbi:hypothetical protein CEXT_556181 [Caerostris extrusa]|uniref:Uncharacterized protein n=1 Tax=Caerostris extrusa TaxID=172846 RepID=A0AAV4RQ03_CAEEX|nr:hypothetical protein CEXT_556181 [Caerostris extrusa]